MNPRRREFDKLYTKINKLAQKGPEYVFDYYNLIDEIIIVGQFSILEDIMIDKYGIPIRNFPSIQDFKEFSFTEIRKYVNSNSAELIQKLMTQKSVYQVGYYLFDKNSNHYLGDIREVETSVTLPYRDKKLIELNTDVTGEVGIVNSELIAIPTFESNPTLTINYSIGQHIVLSNQVYECVQSYKFSSTNRISPTFSEYWTPIYAPTYSKFESTDENLTLVEKYSQVIDFLKGYTYSYSSSENNYVVFNYVDDYSI
jgi:hypothetical protein